MNRDPEQFENNSFIHRKHWAQAAAARAAGLRLSRAWSSPQSRPTALRGLVAASSSGADWVAAQSLRATVRFGCSGVLNLSFRPGPRQQRAGFLWRWLGRYPRAESIALSPRPSLLCFVFHSPPSPCPLRSATTGSRPCSGLGAGEGEEPPRPLSSASCNGRRVELPKMAVAGWQARRGQDRSLLLMETNQEGRAGC